MGHPVLGVQMKANFPKNASLKDEAAASDVGQEVIDAGEPVDALEVVHDGLRRSAARVVRVDRREEGVGPDFRCCRCRRE